MTTARSNPDAIRKAAILVAALDRDSADALLDKMGPDQAARVRHAVFELDEISDEEQDEVMREFVSAGGGVAATMAPGSAHYAEEGGSTRHAPGSEHAAGRSDDAEDFFEAAKSEASRGDKSTALNNNAAVAEGEPAAEGPFPILREASIETLAHHLADENSQVIAVVVAHLPPRRAAELIAQLAPRQQADVLRRVAALDAAAPAAIEILQRQLEAKLTEELRQQRNRTAGLAAVNSILDAAGNRRGELLHNLTENDRPLSQLVARSPDEQATKAGTPGVSATQTRAETAKDDDRPIRAENPGAMDHVTTDHAEPDPPATDRASADRPFADPPGGSAQDDRASTEDSHKNASHPDPPAFERLIELDDADLALLFGALEPELTLVALAGATPEFVARVIRPLPSREARALRRKMERLGPLRLSDIAAAQREVARTAARLIEEGALPRIAASRFAVAA